MNGAIGAIGAIGLTRGPKPEKFKAGRSPGRVHPVE